MLGIARGRFRRAVTVAKESLASYGSYFPFYNFFGLGNDTPFDQTLYNDKYYKARYKGFTVNAFLERTFFQRSVLRVGPTFENYTSDFGGNSYLGTLDSVGDLELIGQHRALAELDIERSESRLPLRRVHAHRSLVYL